MPDQCVGPVHCPCFGLAPFPTAFRGTLHKMAASFRNAYQRFETFPVGVSIEIK